MANGFSIKVGIFKLERTDSPMAGDYSACIVTAASEKAARELANQESGSEGYVWTDGHLVTVTRIGDADEGRNGGIEMWSRE